MSPVLRAAAHIGFSSLSFLVSNGAYAQTMEALGEDFQLCLRASAIYYGQNSCHPPSELLPAVHARCLNIEKEVKTTLTEMGKGDLAEKVLFKVRSRIDSDIVIPTILDQQIAGNCQKH
ncbi:hypothetical protein [Phyllobacterium myrsinacearum]|uniref:Uncharacterized protein n=1 Tax=Phyllobacterium myrsinacearum TaxID=28101 RepID=A0A2S9JB19_9HYPH|nr:hypothetical protein [Phyllobacterium myrsinacearum]PRD49964.1 hypothetical protein C5750_24405 [Phyllobacterium myrsinacearum]PWV86537.1 hypothetical protein DEV92_11619 [Phyllobacterium myrsinacearum]RZS76679.1 hypothetical protein EV217_4894 [Phyllobacterium myrsinacearum]RZU96888.1 hypothetical protein EV654_5072 [Phyllobacterium myrsinacearum]